ncbi:MAG: hypothetical protein H7839_12410 [Magnetococcus sp. YQC-5]
MMENSNIIFAIGNFILLFLTWWVYYSQWRVMKQQLEMMAQQLKMMAQQLEKTQDQIKNDHERSRREETLRIMRFWSERVESQPPSISKIARIFRKLDKVELMKFAKGFAFDLPESEIEIIKSCFPVHENVSFVSENSKCTIDEQKAIFLRRHLLFYLNICEVVAAAWYDQIADRNLLEREFAFAIDSNKDLVIIFNEAIGLYPATMQFIQRPKQSKPMIPTGV